MPLGRADPRRNGQLTCFDQWSKRYRADLTTPNPAQTLGNVLTRADIKSEGFEVALPTAGAGAVPICVQWQQYSCSLGGSGESVLTV